MSYSMLLDNVIVLTIASKVDASERRILSPPLKAVLKPLKWASSINIFAFRSIAATAIKKINKKIIRNVYMVYNDISSKLKM